MGSPRQASLASNVFRYCAARWLGLVLLVLCGAPAAAQPAPALDAAGDTIVALLRHSDFRALSRHLCPRVSYSPYSTNLSKLFATTFSAKDVAKFASSRRRYVWGHYDGIGTEILLTPADYHSKFVYDVDYAAVARKTWLTAKGLADNPDLAALAAAYPGSDVVIYKYAGTEAASRKDSRSLILVFNRSERGHCLRAISHSEDTV